MSEVPLHVLPCEPTYHMHCIFTFGVEVQFWGPGYVVFKGSRIEG